MDSERILALDVGDKRIGLAITDPLGLTAQPLFTLHRTTLRADLKAIARFIRQHKVAAVVVGNPLNADGTPSAQSEKAQRFAKALEAEQPGLEHHLLDERLTTREAHELLDAAGGPVRPTGAAARSRKEIRVSRTEIIDQVAAVLLLEAFLSLRSGPALLPEPGEP
jgi:putative holliday junction resolvase